MSPESNDANSEGTRPKPNLAISGGTGLFGARAVRALVPRYRVFILDAAGWPLRRSPASARSRRRLRCRTS